MAIHKNLGIGAVKHRVKTRPGTLNIRVLMIDRSRWLNGDVISDIHRSSLFNPKSGMMCCLGFACQRLGLTPDEMANIAFPNDVADLIPMPHRTWLADNYVIADMTMVNDDKAPSRAGREKHLIRLFKARGITLSFYGRYPSIKSIESLKATGHA